jgi:hypothetical protein
VLCAQSRTPVPLFASSLHPAKTERHKLADFLAAVEIFKTARLRARETAAEILAKDPKAFSRAVYLVPGGSRAVIDNAWNAFQLFKLLARRRGLDPEHSLFLKRFLEKVSVSPKAARLFVLEEGIASEADIETHLKGVTRRARLKQRLQLGTRLKT